MPAEKVCLIVVAYIIACFVPDKGMFTPDTFKTNGHGHSM